MTPATSARPPVLAPVARASSRRGVVYMVAATTSWGISTAANKATLDRTHMRPLTQHALQLALSVTVLATVTAARGRLPSRRAWRRGATGLLEPGASYVIGLVGLSMTAATHASIIGALEPALVVIGAWMLLRERVSAAAAMLTGLTLVGALTVVTDGSGGGRGEASALGDVLLVVSVACAAAYVMVSSRRARSAAPVTAALSQQVWALGLALPCLAVSVSAVGLGPLPRGRGWLLLAVAAVLSYVLPFALYLTALESLPAPVAARFLSLIPVAGMLGAALVLGERVGMRSLGGAGLVVATLYLLARSDTPRRVAAETGPHGPCRPGRTALSAGRLLARWPRTARR